MPVHRGSSKGVLTPITNKPPSPPSFPTRFAQLPKSVEVQVPPLIAGALSSAFAKALADSLDNALLTHYYRPESKVKINLDRVVDRLMAKFTRSLWDELYSFYDSSTDDSAHQVSLLFEGPVRQIVLILNGPETAKCLLDRLGPGLSKRQSTWSSDAGGIDSLLALKLLCNYWHREKPSYFPKGQPDVIAAALHSKIIAGIASAELVSQIQSTLLSPQHIQMHMAESVVWDLLVTRRSRPPPSDGYHIVQFRYDCQLFGLIKGTGDPNLVSIASLPAITGTADGCVCTTVSDYVGAIWPQTCNVVLECLQKACADVSLSSRSTSTFLGVSLWDAAENNRLQCPSLRLVHLEITAVELRMSVSARVLAMIGVFQQMCWTLAALSASPFPRHLSECAVEVLDIGHDERSAYIRCGLHHTPVTSNNGPLWLRHAQEAAIARGFPLCRPSEQCLS